MRSSLLKNSMTLVITSALLCTTMGLEAAKPSFKLREKTAQVKIAVQKQTASRMTAKTRLKAPAATAGLSALYTYPGVTPYNGYANYISFNIVNNNFTDNATRDYLFFPKDSATTYFDASTGSPTAFLWTAPGATPSTAETQDLDAVYSQEGRFSFPTVKATDGSASSTYTAEGSIKVGGKAEIASFNSLLIDSTFYPSAYQWDSSNGFVSGSNGYGDNGYGNLFFLGQDSAIVESVSVYLRPNPKAANKDNKLKMVIYEVGEDADGYFLPNAKAVATSELKVSEMQAGASAVTGISYADGSEAMGMANFKLATPVKVSSFFFATVENIGNDMAGGDSLCILMNDLDPIPTDSFTTVGSIHSWSHSIVDNAGTYSWIPLYYYLDFNPVLMICPVVNYNLSSQSGINTVSANNFIVTRAAKGFTVMGAKEGNRVTVSTLSGQTVLSSVISEQRQTFSGLSKGIYLVKVGNKVQKVVVY